MSLGPGAWRPELGAKDLGQVGQRPLEVQARSWREQLFVQLSELVAVLALLSRAGDVRASSQIPERA